MAGARQGGMKQLRDTDKQHVGRWVNNRVENSHLPFEGRERATPRYKRMKSLQKCASVRANAHSYFNQERNLIDRQIYRLRRSTALVDWQLLTG